MPIWWPPPTTCSASPDSARPPHEARLHHTAALASASQPPSPATESLTIITITIKMTNQTPSSTPLYVDDLVEGSELVVRQTGAPLGERSRLAARVAAPPIALSPNGCMGRKSGLQGG